MASKPSSKSSAESVSLVEIGCPKCGASYRVGAQLVGRRFQCRKCNHVWRWGLKGSGTLGSGITQPGSDSHVAPLRSGDEGLPMAGSTSSTVIDMSWVGKRLGRYELKSVLGRGGMGVVWRAHDPTLNREIAVKILTTPQGQASNGSLSRALFLQEARAAAKLNHPGAITVFEIADAGGVSFIAMELMHGGMLRDRVEKTGPLDPRELFRLLVPPVKALALAHERGIIHRDVKPGNLMFDDHGMLKIGDFGLSDVTGDPASQSLRGRSVGSLGWVAPETARGEPTTAQSDIYSMGLVMLYALTGKPWLSSESRSKLLALHQNPPELEVDNIPGLTDDGKALLHRCLARDPADRFHTAGELATFLEHCANEPDEPLVPQSLAEKGKLKVALISVGACLVAIVLVVLFVLGYLDQISQSLRKPQLRPRAVSMPAEHVSPAAPNGPPEVVPATPHVEDSEPRTPEPWYGKVDPASLHFVSSKVGRVYHLPSCEGGRKIFIYNLVDYNTTAEAEAAGKHPCPQCHPERSAAASGPAPRD